ncbi:MAG: hypothetical protein WC828_06980 [Thermoleophilia bacterium]|jgi:hypothetical protein
MESELTSTEKITFGERTRQTARGAKTKDEAQVKIDEAKAAARLSAVEKTTFGIASVFSGIVLVVLLMLTIVGFIFSPIADTLVFALLTAATGITSYVIWKGGKCVRGSSSES